MVHDAPGINISQRIRHSQCRAPRRGADSFSYRGDNNICKMLDTFALSKHHSSGYDKAYLMISVSVKKQDNKTRYAAYIDLI